LRQPEGATVDEVARVTGWQRHTVRGVFSGTLKKKLGLTLASVKEERGRVYRIAEPANLWDLLSTLHRLASTLASRPRVSVQTAAETTVCEARTWPGLMAKSPGWSIGRHRSCGVPGGHCITPDRPWASVAISSSGASPISCNSAPMAAR